MESHWGRMEVQMMLEQIMRKVLYPDGNDPVEDEDEDFNVYFEPPPNFQMEYPCIRYKRVRYEPIYANDSPYQLHERFEITAIYYDPDSEIVRNLAMLPMCSHNRHYTSDNLSHDVFILYI